MTRALSLLAAFTDERPEWSLTGLASQAGLNKTTTHRLLTALEESGLVARDEEKELYRLGPEAIAMGGRAMRANPLREVARHELEVLARETGETATLEILVGMMVLIVDEAAASSRLLAGGGEVGMHYPAHATGTGKVLLAAAGFDPIRPLEGATPKTVTDPAALRGELRAAEAQGYAWNVEELERGFAAVGAPIRDGSGRVVAAVGVGGPVTRLADDDFATATQAVVRAARRISTRLGGGHGR